MLLLSKNAASAMPRYQRIKAVGVLELGEGLRILTREPPRMPSKQFLDYNGSSAGDMIGPIVMPKELCGSLPPNQASLLPPDGAPPRSNTTKEPVFFHSYPVSF